MDALISSSRVKSNAHNILPDFELKPICILLEKNALRYPLSTTDLTHLLQYLVLKITTSRIVRCVA